MCSCATCHVYVDPEWLPKLPAAMSDETDMLGDLISRRANSRLSCQITVTDALSGLAVTIAPEE
jgi:ferredoxin, 2Fe-2S